MSFRDLLFSRDSAVWLLLMALSTIAWQLGSHHCIVVQDVRADAALLLLLAFFKVRLVLRYFMEVRHAPYELKWASETWVLGCFVVVTGSYLGLFS